MTPARLLIHLRLLQPSLPLHSSMKLSRSLHSSRPVPALCRPFPFRLRHAGLLAFRANGQLAVRTLSSRSSQYSSGSRASPKSLIDDEAELSDWVSGLGKDDLVGKVSPGKVRGRSSADEVSFGVKRQRYGDSDDVVGLGRRKGRRDVEGLDSRNSRRRYGSELGDGEGRRSDDRSNTRSARSSTWKRGDRDADSRLGQSSRGNANAIRRNAGPLNKYEDETEEEEQEEFMGRFDDLISEEDSEVNSEDYADDEFVKKSTNALFGKEKQAVVENSKRISQQSSDSYLSETR